MKFRLKTVHVLASGFLVFLLYIIHSKSRSLSVQLKFKLNNAPKIQQQEKYITYLPHSGLHNQRISLINGLLLAKLLNRTLLMPELNIGKATSWSITLPQQLDKCPTAAKSKNRTMIRQYKCQHYTQYTPVPMHFIFNLSEATDTLGIKVEQQSDMKQDYITRHAKEHHITDDRYTFKDTDRYSFRFQQGEPDVSNSTIEYQEIIPIESLRDRPEPYLEFGSLFGMSRLVFQDETLNTLRDHLHQSTGIAHPFVLKESARIVRELGDYYTSIHLRQGDGVFKSKIHETLTEIEEKLTVGKDSNNGCHGIIYLATDAKKPKKQFSELYRTYPCIYTLNDFINTATLNKVQRLLLPMIDAEVASRANLFIGTPKSTFSAYIRYRNSNMYMSNHPQKTIQP